VKKFLFALIPLLLLSLAILLPHSTHTNPTTNAQSPATPPPPTVTPWSTLGPTAPLPTVAIWGTPGPTPDFSGVGHFTFNSQVFSDKLDYTANPPRHCLYWPFLYKEIKLQLILLKGTKYPIPGQEQIFVYRDAPESGKDIARELVDRYTDFLDRIGTSEAEARRKELEADHNTTFEREKLITRDEYVCEDPSSGYCMHWHNTDWCPKNNPHPAKEFAQCAAYDHTYTYCKAVLTSLSNTPIETEPGALIKAIFLVTLSLAGGVSVILIIAAGYKILTSNGKPEAIQAGREQLTSALVGLLFIIFSYVIFQFIVADLLRIPGVTN
jgi:hypothetical protein